MKRDAEPSAEGFLSRWSRLKRESGPDPVAVEGMPSPASEVTARDDRLLVPGTVPGPSTTFTSTTTSPLTLASSATPTSSRTQTSNSAPPPLPAIDTLNFDSDYTAFFQPRVPDDLRRAAVKKLFADPHFNIMDGLDVYIDDYSKPDPLPEGWLEQIAHARDLIDHPSNRKPVEEVVPVEAEASTASAESVGGDAAANSDATASSDAIANSDATSDPLPTNHRAFALEPSVEAVASPSRSNATTES